MTRTQLEKIVRTWQTRLKLDHWEVVVDWKNFADPDCVASTHRARDYDTAVITLASNWETWELVYAAKTIAHELMHLQTRDLDEAVREAGEFVAPDMWRTLERRIFHENEGLVDRLATIVVDLMGPT